MNRRDRQGFSMVELMLAVAVFGMLVLAIAGSIIFGNVSIASSGERVRANMLAEEGLEAVRNIKDADFTNLVDGTYGLTQAGGIWTLSGTSDVTGIFTRQITVASAGTGRKTITANVSWPQGGGAPRSVTVSTRLANWRAQLTPPAPTTGPIMMAYSKTTATPFYRTWNGTAWGAEGSAQAVTGNVNHIALKSSKTRNEAILGTQTSTGAIFIQIWNGTVWSAATQVGTASTTMRSFDISYEKTSGRAVIAYGSGADFAYRIWDGTTLSAATTVTTPPTTGALNWLELRQNPVGASNQIAMVMLDANADVYGMVWTGTAWSNMGVATVWDATAATATKKTIDIEFENISGRAMFMWGDGLATDQQYRIWDGSTLTAPTLLDIPAQGGLSEWVQLAARPNTNEIMVGVQDAGADLNTRKWSGTAWDTVTQHPEHAATTENILSRNFDIVYETHSSNLGKAWIVWGNGATRSERLWSGTAWGTTTVATGSDDTSFVRLRADDASGTVFSGIYQSSTSAVANRDINERFLINGTATWSGSNPVWGGPTTADPAHFKIDIATP